MVDRWPAWAPALWRKLIFTNRGRAQIVTVTDKRLWVKGAVIPWAQVITATPDAKDQPDAKPELWQYAHPQPDRLIVERVEDGKRLRITLARERAPLLLTRGFHWVPKPPFNR